ncbi:outer membrane beta-barrel protein [Pontibacter oryzae]|uniref:Outer membrane protein beta-barrel domain-containing protein n=1 Tax=Pontibacter oryzae TaxID=2304593 RepID=A0A399SFR3_9BACT|nr:outer membrane beta-barrel protein [Pontibacter oryzae]RIJ42440.1 hypothetical protein D1627_00785 [Pontibacter oryzae]
MKTNFRNLLATAFLTVASYGAFAQTSAGSIELSGSLGFSSDNIDNGSQNNNETKISSFSIGPSVGYFFADNLAAGISLSYGYNNYNASSLVYTGSGYMEVDQTNKTNSYSIAPYIKKYYTLSDKVAVSVSGSVGFSKSKYTTDYDSYYLDQEYTTNGLRVGVSPGITFFPTPKIGISASFGSLAYSRSKTEHKSENMQPDTKQSSFGLNLDSNTFFFGFGYYINR